MNEKFKQEIRTIIRRNLIAGTPEKIRKQIKDLLTKKVSDKVIKVEIEQLRKEVEKEFENEFVKTKTAKSEYLNDARKIIRSAAKQSDQLKDKLAKTIFDSIEQGIEEKSDWKEIAKETLRQIDITGFKLDTELETHKAALDRLTRIKNLEESGWEYLEYAGPTGTIRPFCVEHIGRVYHIEEVKEMKNMFGQPALYYQGGYNCRHRWDPVEGQIIEQNADGRIFTQKDFKESRDGKETEIAKMRLKQLGNSSTIILNNKTEIKDSKSADAFENGIKTEYKRISEKALNLSTAIRNNLRSGKEQAGRIVIWINKDYESEIIKKAIKSAKHFDLKKKIEEIYLLDKNGKEIKL
ncbi:MAG: hypothetical protein AMXMBFR51_20930 [Ignavibacteriota bacterium]